MARIPLARPVISEEMVQAMAQALRDERLVMGESVFRFEDEFARYVGTDHAVSVSSGTDALTLAMLAMNVRAREVITTPFSFVATATSVVHAGATPIFADVLADGNIDPSEVMPTRDTAAVLPVHLYGNPARMDEIAEAAPNVRIIEDACQAHGASYKGRKCGAIGDAGCFSFYTTKNMTVGGDGGMVTTNDERLANDLRKLRDCGRVSRYEHDVFGFTSRLNTANAAFGRVQLRHLDEWNERRRALARRYSERLKDVMEIKLPTLGTRDAVPVFHLFVVRCDDRDSLARYLGENGVETAVHYPIPIHLQPAYRDAYGFARGSYPASERMADTALSLPLFPEMEEGQVDEVCRLVIEHYGGKG